MKKFIFVILIFIGIFVSIFIISVYIIFRYNTSPLSFAEFLNTNQNKSSIIYSVNDTVKLNINSNKEMPLASTLKWIILLKYCYLVDIDAINPNKTIPIDSINIYYLPNSDGGAHEKWLKNKSKFVSLRDIVKGMILYSSNANSEYLTDLFNKDSINRFIEQLHIKQDNITFLSSYTYYIGKTDPNDIVKLNYNELTKKIDSIHNLVKNQSIKLSNSIEFTEQQEHLFSLKMPKSSTYEYYKLMKILNNREI